MQRFEQQPVYTEVNPGQDALLVCKVYNKRGTCSWQKDHKPVGMYMHKYEWSGSQDTGDCSLWIRASQIDFDDGSWECQVTASDFHTQDALSSFPIRLVVRVQPRKPKIEYNQNQVLPGHNLTALHGQLAVIKCVSHFGNPPPILKWFLDQNEVTPIRKQENMTEIDIPKTWVAISILELTISKENHGKALRCVAVHETYATKSSSVEVRLDVMYIPETRLLGIPANDIEESKDSVAIRCVVSANPKANVVWRRQGQTQAASLQELLQFSPVLRQHAGYYICQARNKAGESHPVMVQLDVKYPPKILSIGPDRLTTAPLFSSATFECVAEGNPQPTYQWLQRLPIPSDVILERGWESKLHIANVTYDYQGEYVCKVTNIIGGTERTIQSEAIALQVVGAPQVLRHITSPEIIVEKGETAKISLVVCADPRPRVVAWEWGSLRLEAGSELGRYHVDDVIQESREDCYLATLRIRDTDVTDSRSYYLAVENDRGIDRHVVQLYVNEPLDVGTLVSLGAVGLAISLLMVCGCVYAIRTERWCFARKGDFKPADMNGDKKDIEKIPTGPGGIPADAIYTTASRDGRHNSPETMKQPSFPFNGRHNLEGHRKDNICLGLDSSVHHYQVRTLMPGYHNSNNARKGFYKTKIPNKRSSNFSLYINGNNSVENRINFDDVNKSFLDTERYSHTKKYKNRERPKPLPPDNQKYYDHIFPKNLKYKSSHMFYEPNSLNYAEL